MDEQQKQTILDIPKVIAVGIASPVATLLTSRFGIAGTLIGLALSAVILTTLVDVLRACLVRDRVGSRGPEIGFLWERGAVGGLFLWGSFLGFRSVST